MSSSGLQKLSLKRPDARYNLGDTAGSDPARLDAAPVDSVRGRRRLFQGYASGFGKSFRMFDEARRRKKRGQDLVAEHKLVQGHPMELSSILASTPTSRRRPLWGRLGMFGIR
jgi:hypothetical protein